MSKDELFKALKARGNFNHLGRPGKRGGSLPRGGTNMSVVNPEIVNKVLNHTFTKTPTVVAENITPDEERGLVGELYKNGFHMRGFSTADKGKTWFKYERDNKDYVITESDYSLSRDKNWTVKAGNSVDESKYPSRPNLLLKPFFNAQGIHEED